MDIAFTIPTGLITVIAVWLGIGVIWWAVWWFVFTNTEKQRTRGGWAQEDTRRLLAVILVWPIMAGILMWKAAWTLVAEEDFFRLTPPAEPDPEAIVVVVEEEKPVSSPARKRAPRTPPAN